MASLFSRSRKNSAPKMKHSTSSPLPAPRMDEFGRVDSPMPPPMSKRKGKNDRAPSPLPDVPPEPAFTGFLPLRLDPPEPVASSAAAAAGVMAGTDDRREAAPEHGFLAHKRHVILSLDACAALVRALADALGARALATPFVFASTAIGASASATRKLVDAYLITLRRAPSATLDEERRRAWADELRFADPHALGHALRWGLSRLVRVQAGVPMRGLMDWELYVQWRDAEIGSCTLLSSPSPALTHRCPLSSPELPAHSLLHPSPRT
jgi:hypothetical protein